MVNNPRFTHRLEIFRSRKTENGEPELDEQNNEIFDKIFESECGLRSKDGNVNVNAEVIKADYKLALPKHSQIIKKTDRIVFTNGINGEIITGTVKDSKVFNMGANIWINVIDN